MSVEKQLAELRAVTDRVEIQETLARYATAVDGGRWELLDDVFTKGAIIDFEANGGQCDAYPAIIDYLKAALGGFAAIQHYFMNFLFDVDGDRASGRFYCFTQMVTIVDGRDQMLSDGGYYDATFARTDKGWRVTELIGGLTWLDGQWPEGVPRPGWFGQSTDRF
jgi:SnoaL-like domain